MCDYSLQHVASIPAKVGDRLVTTEFAHSATRGFSAIGRPDVAVCVRPGTELAFERDVVCNDPIGFSPSRRKIAAGVARFRQVNVDQPYVHHDALEFPDGRIVMVTDLAPGQNAVVLQLPAVAAPEDKRAEVRSAPALTTG
ncbi:MAG: hypothetical protein ABSC22_14305 [Roseiarcus sp.]|jgi:hypothetical protein